MAVPLNASFATTNPNPPLNFHDHLLSILTGLVESPPSSQPIYIPPYQLADASPQTDAILTQLSVLAAKLSPAEGIPSAPGSGFNALLTPSTSGDSAKFSASHSDQPMDVDLPLSLMPSRDPLKTTVANSQPMSTSTSVSGESILTSGHNINSGAYESGLGPVEELRLLRAQVQDIARVCKVRPLCII